MTNLHKEIQDAQRAKDSLEYIQEVFDNMREELLESWLSSPVRDPEGRESIWMMIRMMDKFKNILESKIDTGKMAQQQLDLERKHDRREK